MPRILSSSYSYIGNSYFFVFYIKPLHLRIGNLNKQIFKSDNKMCYLFYIYINGQAFISFSKLVIFFNKNVLNWFVTSPPTGSLLENMRQLLGQQHVYVVVSRHKFIFSLSTNVQLHKCIFFFLSNFLYRKKAKMYEFWYVICTLKIVNMKVLICWEIQNTSATYFLFKTSFCEHYFVII